MALVLSSSNAASTKGSEHSINRTAKNPKECPNCDNIAEHVRAWNLFENKNEHIEIAAWQDFQTAANCPDCRKLVRYFEVNWPLRAGQSHSKDVLQISASKGRLALRIVPVRLAFF